MENQIVQRNWTAPNFLIRWSLYQNNNSNDNDDHDNSSDSGIWPMDLNNAITPHSILCLCPTITIFTEILFIYFLILFGAINLQTWLFDEPRKKKCKKESTVEMDCWFSCVFFSIDFWIFEPQSHEYFNRW